MKHSVNESSDALGGWESEIFVDFVSDCGSPHEEIDETSIAELDGVKDVLTMLQLQGSKADEPALADALPDPRLDAEADTGQEVSIEKTIKPAVLDLIECPELTSAYLEDSSRGIAALEQAVINYETNTHRTEALGQICRELHTLKGASAVVGLTDTSRYLHDIEDFVEDGGNSATELTDVLLNCLETLRQQAARLNAGLSGAETAGETTKEAAHRIDGTSDGEDAISVKGEQLDRLLDMVTALTMLNNQRESYIDQLRNVNANLNQCGSRIRDVEKMLTKANSTEHSAELFPSIGNSVREIGNDIGAISKLLRDSYAPISQEHSAVQNFTRQFRHALVEILRMPVSGMFRRLQRAAVDAARVERKRVRLEVIGSDSGLERSVQERLLDPLMHIVRNAVSHGIESPADRKSQGKDPVGTVTLEAISSPNLLTLNVRDDGRGLDYEALRKKGMQLGLLRNGRDATQQELGQLIFRPGFSTREQANGIAGRGIGMDVVVAALEKMHAWIEVDSVSGQGTTIKLFVPLKSITEHALVVRFGEHLAALPMQYVHCADDRPVCDTGYPELAHVLGLPGSGAAKSLVSVECVTTDSRQHTACCLVDEILGPQEVVVRPLPPLLRHQQMLAGVTLSATGDVVYVLDPRRIATTVETITRGESCPRTPNGAFPDEASPIKILVVDDSLSARLAIAQFCRKQGWEPFEAQNGIAGLELIDQEDWSAVITDFDMPQMDGIQFVEALRNRASMKNVPVLMASSRPAAEMEAKAKSAGATQYITKPLTVDVLHAFLFPRPKNDRKTNG